MNEIQAVIGLLIVLTAVCVLSLALIGFVLRYGIFTRELRRLNNEVSRTYGAERGYWVRRRRRLWLSLLPFVKY